MQKELPVVLIPALNPDERLLDLINKISKNPNMHIIIVNDGSKKECAKIFANIKERNNCHVINHEKNCGKGISLKTGMNYFLNNFPNSSGIVTADCDGQHTSQDIALIANTLMKNPKKLVLGVRKFDKKSIPFRSRFGNKLTALLFQVLVGLRISDTQTGLRGLPVFHLPLISKLSGERFEYELNMLLACKKARIRIKEEPIATIYLDDNKSSHFNPILDSIKIYFVLMKYVSATIFSFAFDYGLFLLALFILEKYYTQNLAVFLSIIFSRTISSPVNYVINCQTVFKGRARDSFWRYYFVSTTQMFLSALAVTGLQWTFSGGTNFFKILVDLLLLIIVFPIRAQWVFANKKDLAVSAITDETAKVGVLSSLFNKKL